MRYRDNGVFYSINISKREAKRLFRQQFGRG